jgi:hypothetical protein
MSNPLIGLTGSVNDRDQAYRDIAQTESLYGMMEQKKQAEMQSQQMEAAAFDEMYKSTDQLLEKDRKRINKKILLSQNQLRDQIGEAGGSRKDFFEKGGISALNNIKNSIIRSDENIRYQENKKNLTNIRLAEKDGLGARLIPKDRQSVEDYYNNPDGATITYSGMMSDVEIPPSNAFNVGTQIHPEYVASYKGNMTKILGNYQMMYPERIVPDPLTRDGLDVINRYVTQMGWGGVGTREPRVPKTTTGSTTDKRTAAQRDMEDKVTYNNNYRTWISDTGQQSVDDVVSAEKEGGFIGKRKKGDAENGIPSDKMTTAMARKKSDLIVEDNGLNKDGFEAIDLVLWPWVRDAWSDIADSQVQLKDSYNVYEANTGAVVKAVLSSEEENGFGYKMDGRYVLDYEPKGDVYTSRGIRVGSTKLDDEYKGKYEVLGVKTAWEMTAGDGNDPDKSALMINVMQGGGIRGTDGTVDQKATDKIDAGYKGDNPGGTAKLATVIALKNENGDTFYHKIDLDDDALNTKLSGMMAENNDLTETVQLDRTTQERQQAASKMNQQERVALETGKKETAEIFAGQESDFGFEMEGYQGANSGGQKNRDKLAKSFYLANDYAQRELEDPEQDPKNWYVDKNDVASDVKSKGFTEEVGKAQGMNEKLHDYENYNNEQLVQAWYEEVQAGLEPESQEYRVNKHIADRWKQFLQNY